ncbi:hypothetical protein VTK73DRAFT_1611 [Phialemonium thermophilum]|uniref:Splicing factor YJU2 n=1 Tax=Phialemonium thermophilum TaxID=223376 RepID=A0ABR3Y379_9PEZI
MSERKVLTKYYPADFDPSKLGRTKKPKQTGPRVQSVRLMLPFSLRCTTCGEYMGKGRKFNARKETPPDEKYLNIQIYRFFIRCTRCSGEIVFRTDPRHFDYICERGAKRNTDPWKRGLGEDPERDETDEQRLDRLEREMAEEEERNAMAELEAKTIDAKREMAVADALDEIRSRNARIERAHREGADATVDLSILHPEDEERLRQEKEDEEAARRAFAFARAHELLEETIEEDGAGGGSEATPGSAAGESNNRANDAASVSPPPKPAASIADIPPPTFKRQVKKKKDHAALLGIKKKAPLV